MEVLEDSRSMEAEVVVWLQLEDKGAWLGRGCRVSSGVCWTGPHPVEAGTEAPEDTVEAAPTPEAAPRLDTAEAVQ